MSTITFGVAGSGRALGERHRVEDVILNYTENVDKIRGWGYEHVYIAPPEVGITDLAVQAAEAALQHAEVRAEDVDFIALAISDIPEYLFWDQGCELQRRIGAMNAEVIVINHACTSGLMAFDIVAGKYAINPNFQNVLVVAANRTCEAYRNRATYNSCLHSDGAVAYLVKRDHPHCKWLATKTLTDGTYSPLFRVDMGGSKEPFNAENLQLLKELNPLAKVQEFFDGDVLKLMDFIKLLNQRNKQVVEQACQQAGIQVSDLRRVLYVHDNQKSMKEVAAEFGIPLEQTNAALAAQYSHIGTADQMLDLQLLIESGELQQGDYVALLSIGVGMHWSSAVFQV